MQAEITKLTPELAAEFLKYNTQNRALSRSKVKEYADAIKRNEWLLNGETIIFKKDGTMANGQHRCHAVILAGKPIDVLVFKGADNDSFKTIDRAKQRSIGEVLQVAGEKNGSKIAAAAKAYLQITTRQLVRILTATEALKIIEQTPQLRYWTNNFAGSKRLQKLFTSTLAGALCAGAEVYGSDVMLGFMNKLDSGENLFDGDPALALREKFIERKRGQVFSSDYCIALYVKAIAAHGTGKKIRTLRMLPTESVVPALK